MKIIYQSIWVELPYEAVQITYVKMQQTLNCHAYLRLKAVIAQEDKNRVEETAVEQEKVRAGYLGTEQTLPFFSGSICEASCYYEKGQTMLALTCASETAKWDIAIRRRTFQNRDFTYGDVITEVLSAYPGSSWISRSDTERKIPGLLLQYDETDWEFLCRLASHFGAYVTAVPSGEEGQVYFGLPDADRGGQADESTYTITQDMGQYMTYTGNVEEIMMQDNLIWEVTAGDVWELGEKVTWNHAVCRVAGAVMYTQGAELLYRYRIGREKGNKSFPYGNERISGLSLPAVIRERRGNCLRVHFSIDPVYSPGNNVFFTYAIETTSWYCMPEEGSLVHIYFPCEDETAAIAVHAMRVSRGPGCVSAAGAIEDKSFSTPDGKAMKFTKSSVWFVSDENEASVVVASKRGTVTMRSANLVFCADTGMHIGEACVLAGEAEEEVTVKELVLEARGGILLMGILTGGEELTLYEDRGILLGEDGSMALAGPKMISYMGIRKDPPGIVYSDEKLLAIDTEQRKAHNAQVFEVREQESKAKIGVGTVLAVVGVTIAVVGIEILSGGLATPAVLAAGGVAGGTLSTGGVIVAGGMAAGGGIGAVMGAFKAEEGKQDLQKISSGDFSQSYNPILEAMGGDQELYDTVMFGSIAIGANLLLAAYMPGAVQGLGKLGRMLGQMGAAALTDVGIGLTSDLSDGYIDKSWQDYAESAGIAAFTAGVGYAVGTGVAGLKGTTAVGKMLEKAGSAAPLLVIGAETGIDVVTDWGLSQVTGREFNAAASVITALAGNIIFSIDPVNMATGAFCLTAVDLTFPDLLEDRFRISRIYNSALPCRGAMGRNWMLSLESRVLVWEEEGLASVICTDGHVEKFRLTQAGWESCRGGDERYRLQMCPGEGGCTLIYIPEQRCYDYDRDGRLLCVRGKGRLRMDIRYREGYIREVVSSAGYVLKFCYEDGRIAEISDGLGRTLRYRYEDGLLKAVCHVDEGVTTYYYDEAGHITQVIDQNGSAYVTNEYDEKGRVTAQHYPDGTTSAITYEPEKRENTVYIEALGRTERYLYNSDMLITHIFYDDGTCEQTEYDRWTNPVRKTDRNGNVTEYCYDARGLLIRETLPSGQRWDYRYNEEGNLLSREADTGQAFRFLYDEAGYVWEEAEKISNTLWKHTRWQRDSYGRPLRKTDSLDRVTVYSYEDVGGCIQPEPSAVTDPLGHTVCYEYDRVGRRTAVKTEGGTTEIRYNRQNYPSYVRDGAGNETRRSYDRMGSLTVLLPPNQGTDGRAWRYRYDFFGHLVETTDPLGGVEKKQCSLAGDILSETTPEGRTTMYDYDTDSRRIRTIYPDGSVERCFYDGNGNLTKKVSPEHYDRQTDDGPGTLYEYDSMNRLVRTADETGRTIRAFRYDTSGRLTEETGEGGYTVFHAYDLVGRRTATWEPAEQTEDGMLYSAILYEYDTEGNKLLEKRGIDKVRKGQYPSRCHEIRFSYDALNRLISVSDAYGAKTTYRYDANNRKTSETFLTDPGRERTIHYTYDRAGNMTERREAIEQLSPAPFPASRTAWAVTRYEYDANGNRTREISPEGYEHIWEYDALDRTVYEEHRDPDNNICRKYRYVYDRDGNLLSRTDESLTIQTCRTYQYDNRGRLILLTDEEAASTRLHYDRDDRITKVIRPEQCDMTSGGPDSGPGITYAYDSRGRIIRITGPDGETLREQTYDDAGNIRSVTCGGQAYTSYDYDPAGRPTAAYAGKSRAGKADPSQTWTYDAGGNITAVTDGNHNTTRFLLDDWGRITEIHTPDGGVEKYDYDYTGNITASTDANGNITAYAYNTRGLLASITDCSGAAETFSYDREGRMTVHTDRNGNTETVRYNIDGNPVYRRAEDKKGKNPSVCQYAYYPDGRLKQAGGGRTAYQYEYTKTGLLRQKKSGGVPMLSYCYDANGNVIRLTDHRGKSTGYAYDAMNRLTEVRDWDGTALASYRYDAAGSVNSLRYGNGVQTHYSYADDGSLSDLVTVMPDGTTLLDLNYVYDGNGNCVRKGGDTYAYDAMNRLTEASCGCTDDQNHNEPRNCRQRYTYDHAGNRLTKETADGTERCTYNALGQLTALHKPDGSTVRYTYDRQGNLLQETGAKTRTYTYDPLNRQTGMTEPSLTWQCHYDAEGLRYKTEANGEPTYYLYDRANLLCEDAKPASAVRYIRGLDTISSQQQDGDRYFHVRDELGSALFLLDENHNIRKTYCYDPFGILTSETGDASNRLTYTGQQYDRQTGQYYLRARYYNPVIGRFTQQDTYRGDGLNLYAYCANNPVRYVDPSGHMSELYGYDPENPAYEGGPGIWEKTNESMSNGSKAYQKFVTGADEGMVYKVNGVKFDGYKDGVLIEAKGNYSNFVNKNTGEFYDWFGGKESLISQANRQIIAANGTGIQWYFNDSTSMEAVKNLFNGQIHGIDFILKPMN